ncbi:MAG: IS110 family transposase [Nitrosopumilus sp.]
MSSLHIEWSVLSCSIGERQALIDVCSISSRPKRGGENLKNIAVDIGKKKCAVCITDEYGTILEETIFENTLKAASLFAEEVLQRYQKCQAVCESTGNLWIKIHDTFERYGIAVKLANPLKTRAIAEATVKTDKLDARTLAHLLRSGMVSECYIASVHIRSNRLLLRHRTSLVQDRTRVVNRIHSLLDKYDLQYEGGRIFNLRGMSWLKNQNLGDANDYTMLQQCTRNIEYINNEIHAIEKKIAQEAAKNESVRILMSMTGVDYFAAMLISSEIGDIARFATPRKLVSWSGLCPTVHQSGDSLYHGRMKKDANKRVKWVMIQAANVAVRCDERMKSFYVRICKRHGHAVALTHVANKMMTIMWHMLTTKTQYMQQNTKLYQKKLKKIDRISSH